MTHTQRKVGIILSLCLMITLLVCSGVFATAVFGNSHIWQDKYLSAVYAGNVEGQVYTFQNLADAQLKIKTVEKGEPIILLESNIRPVVKNFESVLNINGYTDVTTVKYDDYVELQFLLLDRVKSEHDVVSVAVLDPQFSIEAVSVAPLLYKKGLVPLFLTSDSAKDIERELQSNTGGMVVGKIPLRLIDAVVNDNVELITGEHVDNVRDITEQTLVTYTDIWGTLMRPDMTDLSTMLRDTPIILYFGSVEDTAKLIENSELENFEVIGGRLADTAKAIEQESGRDLKFLLKYGRTITQVEGLEGEILNIDVENFPFPFVQVAVVDATYYVENGKLAISFQNSGNINALIFSNIEFGTQALTDENTYAIPAGETITISYDVEADAVGEVTINTLYGDKFPLSQQIQGDDGRSFVKEELIQKSGSLQTDVEITKAKLDTSDGILYVTVKNLGDERVDTHIQMPLNATLTLASSQVTLLGGETEHVPIPVPFLSNEELLDRDVQFIAFQGSDQTIFINAQFVGITKRADGGVITIIVIVLIVILLIVGLILGLRKKGSGSSYKRRR